MLYVYNCEQQQQNEHKPQPARVCGLDEEEKVYMKIKNHCIVWNLWNCFWFQEFSHIHCICYIYTHSGK